MARSLGMNTQTIAAYYAPLRFRTSRGESGLSLEGFALSPAVDCFSRLVIDLVTARYVDRIGYRLCILTAQALSLLELGGRAFLPDLPPDPFLAILLCIEIRGMGSGILVVYICPRVDACPSENMGQFEPSPFFFIVSARPWNMQSTV